MLWSGECSRVLFSLGENSAKGSASLYTFRRFAIGMFWSTPTEREASLLVAERSELLEGPHRLTAIPQSIDKRHLLRIPAHLHHKVLRGNRSHIPERVPGPHCHNDHVAGPRPLRLTVVLELHRSLANQDHLRMVDRVRWIGWNPGRQYRLMRRHLLASRQDSMHRIPALAAVRQPSQRHPFRSHHPWPGQRLRRPRRSLPPCHSR